MSFTRQFSVQNELNSASQPISELDITDPTPRDYQATFAAALGLNTVGMVEVIISDLAKMIEKNQRFSLEGYVQCLYRIMSRKLAWECIVQAYVSKNESVPTKIKELFGMDEYQVKPRNKIVAE